LDFRFWNYWRQFRASHPTLIPIGLRRRQPIQNLVGFLVG
jgi:hypothetical protein